MTEHTPEPLDTVSWERDGGLHTGIILAVRHDVAEIVTGHGSALVRISDLRIIVPRDQWDEESLRNHLRAVYGVET